MHQNTDFPLGGEDLHCGSSTRSLSVASASGSAPSPYTPTSGRSTPAYLPMMIESLNLDMTTSHTLYGNSMSSTGAEPTQYFDMGYSQYPQQLVTPPGEHPPIQFIHEGYNQYDPMPAYSFLAESQPLLDGKVINGVSPSMSGGFYPPSYYSVQERSAALHQVQGRSRIPKRTEIPMVMIQRQTRENTERNIPAVLLQSGAHKCPHPQCVDRKPFKRQEHLKRHETTVHSGKEHHKCPFCSTGFNRTDNYRVHLELHTHTKGRTPYFEEALAVFLEEQSKTKPRRQGRKPARVRTLSKAARRQRANRL